MLRTVLRWLVSSVALLLVLTAVTFVIESLDPGSAVQQVLGGQTRYSHAQYVSVEHQLGLNKSLPTQYWDWLTHLVVHGNLGSDLFSGQSVSQALNGRLGASLSIIIGTVLLAGFLGVAFGVTAAVRGGIVGRGLEVLSVLGFSLPNFWLALVLSEVFAVKLGWLPATGYTQFGTNPFHWLQSLVLPVLTLTAGTTAFVARQTRDSMLQVLSRDFITALRARGVPLGSIILRHALRNAAIPVVTTLGILFISLLGGTVFVENVFAIPGLGQEAVNASSIHDFPLLEGIALYFGVIVVVVNLLVDLSYIKLDPRMGATR